MRSLALLFCIAACGAPAAPEHVEPAASPAEATERAAVAETDLPAADLCLPMVSGCGCSALCARGTRHLEGQRYEVSHAGQRSRIDIGTLSRWCFTPEGIGTLQGEGSVEPVGTTCVDAFWVGACGGECIPTPIPSCGFVDGSCVAL